VNGTAASLYAFAARQSILLALLAVSAALALTGCGSSTLPTHETARIGDGADDQAPVLDDGWGRYLIDPGTPGVDYDADTLLVGYRRGASAADLPPGVSGDGAVIEDAGTGSRATGGAASRSNPMLRENRQFEAVSDAVAGALRLSIDQQVYLRKLNFATFDVPAGVSADAAVAALRSPAWAGVVEYAAYAPMIYPCYESNDPGYTSSNENNGWQWSLKKSNFNTAWDSTKGSSDVLVAVVDTGCYLDHEDLGGILDPQVAFPSATTDIANNDNTMEDSNEHGTFLCGLVGATMDNGTGITGGAPGCRTFAVKISEDGGGVNHGTFITGCMLGFTLGAKVVNLSWRSTGGSPPLRTMTEDIWNGGGILFVSAGNDGNDNPTWPAAYDDAVAVGNSNSADACDPSSSRGDWVDIAAPGVGLTSCGSHFPGDYHGPWVGTSFSAPLTAAAAALLWSYQPALTNTEVRDYLEDTGAPTTGFNASNSILRLDVRAALDAIPPLVDPIAVDSVVATQTLLGNVNHVAQFSARVLGAENVDRVRYTIDCVPLGEFDPTDVMLDVETNGVFLTVLELGEVDRMNQQAQLTAQVYDALGNPGPLVTTPLWIFNHPGDVNADGEVDAADSVAFEDRLGLTEDDPSYEPFYDSDLDGVITEGDAAAIGYFWGD
jgi:hypothetical protein